jgi:hypothetical protein
MRLGFCTGILRLRALMRSHIMVPRSMSILVTTAVHCTVIPLCIAQQYSIPSAVFSAGGGTVAAGPYTLSFTVGQGIVDRTSNSTFSNSAGFWYAASGLSGGSASAGTYFVTTTQDSVAGSFRAAIDSANLSPGLNLISFNIPGPGVHTLTFKSPLPALTGPTIIDGYTQPGASPNTRSLDSSSNAHLMIQVDGSQSPYDAVCLHLSGGNSTVRGLIITHHSLGAGTGILVDEKGSNLIEGNYIGIDTSGSTGAGNSIGIKLVSGTNAIGGTTAASRNVISANNQGIVISGSGATGNSVFGNYLGLSASGTDNLTNATGIWLEAAGNSVGGADPRMRNIILGGVNAAIWNPAGSGGNNLIQRNYVGTNAAGTAGLGAAGISVMTPQNVIRQNLITGNRGLNIQEAGAFGNVVQGNWFGISADGSQPLSNHGAGISLVRVSHTLLGGANAADRNVIAVSGAGISISEGDSNIVQGNYIGTNISGTQAMIPGGAAGDGIAIVSSYNQIGGVMGGTGNVIANCYSGISMGAGATGNIIQGNLIGTNATGTAPLGNSHEGIKCVPPNFAPRVRKNLLGGTTPGTGNLIAGNAGAGIYMDASDSNIVMGNLIGVAMDGSSPLPNGGSGVELSDANFNAIGGADSAAGNTIAYNGSQGNHSARGVKIWSGSGNAIQGNSIYSNYGIGIDLVGGIESVFGVTANDSSDTDAGPNMLQNYPVLTSVATNGIRLSVVGALKSQGPAKYRIEFFSNQKPDTSKYGQGMIYLGSIDVRTDSTNNASFLANLPIGDTVHRYVAATATDTSGNTSEFSMAVSFGTVDVREIQAQLPSEYRLEQNYPNPFNPSTTIKFELPKASQVNLTVYDILGRRVSLLANEKMDGGVHELKFDASGLASGVYFYRLQAGSFVDTKKLLLVR